MKKAQQLKRAQRLLTGLIIEWTDRDPQGDNEQIENENVTHTSPVLRLQADKVWHDYRDFIMHRQALLWRIDIDLVFRYPNGRDQIEQRRVIARETLHDIGHACEPYIDNAMKHGANLFEARFRVECLGARSATDADFGDFQSS